MEMLRFAFILFFSLAISVSASDTSSFHFETARALYSAGQYTAALAQLDQSAGIAEPAPDRELFRGLCLAQLDRWTEARGPLALATAASPLNAEAWYWLGASDYYLHDYDRAMDSLDKAIRLDPRDGDAYRMRGLVHLQRNRWNEGYLDWAKAVQLNPRDVKTLNYIGQLFHEAGRCDQAKLYLEDAVKVDPKHVEALTYLGLCEERLANPERAAQLYQRAIAAGTAAGKPYSWAYLSLAKLWRNSGRSDDARALLDSAAVLAPEPSLLYTLAQTQFEANQTAAAETNLRRALEANPNLNEAHYLLSRVLAAQGRRAESRAELEKFRIAKQTAKPTPKVTVVAR